MKLMLAPILIGRGRRAGCATGRGARTRPRSASSSLSAAEIYFLIPMLTAVVLAGAGVALILMQVKFPSFGGYVDSMILGGVFIVVLSFLPRGLAGPVGDAARAASRRRDRSGSPA